MKSMINKREEEGDLEYPCLRMHRRGDLVVLFSSINCGTVVFISGDGAGAANNLGDYRSIWHNANNTALWLPFKGSITLKG